jgi:hypothetical protein
MDFFQPVAPLDVQTGKLVFMLTNVEMILTSVGMYSVDATVRVDVTTVNSEKL